jgi:excisionase family DNA binding protein
MSRSEPLIDCKRAAEIVSLHPKTVKQLAAAGRIPGLKIGSVWRFRESALDAWISLHLKLSMPLAAAGKEEANEEN